MGTVKDGEREKKPTANPKICGMLQHRRYDELMQHLALHIDNSFLFLYFHYIKQGRLLSVEIKTFHSALKGTQFPKDQLTLCVCVCVGPVGYAETGRAKGI